MAIRVKATKAGFYDHYRKPDEIFNVKDIHRKATWYVPVELMDKVEKSSERAAPSSKKKDVGSEDDNLVFEDDLVG